MNNPQPPPIHPPPPVIRQRWAHTARRTGVIAALFCGLVAIVMIVQYQPQSREEPLTSAALKQKREQLIRSPKDETLKEEIRRIDADLRTRFFVTRQSRRQGAWLLLGGAILAIAVLKVAGKLCEVPDDPRARPQPDPGQTAAAGRLGIMVIGLAVLGACAALALAGREIQPFALASGESDPLEGGPQKPRAPDFPTAEEWNCEWPIFRGPSGDGIAHADRAPTEWDGVAGSGVRWKVPVPPLPGDNSPVVWGKRLFISGATAEKRQVYAFDTETGELLWHQDVTNPGTVSVPPPKPMEETGFAPNTLATDGRRVYAIFVNGDLAAFTVEGRQVWVKNLGKPDNAYGHASSLSMWRNLLIIQYDQKGNDKSALIAVDGATGKQVWRTSRPVTDSWCTPLVIRNRPQEEIVCSGRPWVMGYAPESGKERWRAKLLDADIAPTPCYSKGLVFVTNAYATLAAVRLGGTGDVTQSHVVWQADDGLPDCVSPICDGEGVYVFDSTGLLTCYEAATGIKRYDREFPSPFNASPVLVGKTLYCLDTKGLMHFIEVGATYKELGTAPLGEEAHASPAVFKDRIYIRGREHLFAIGAKP